MPVRLNKKWRIVNWIKICKIRLNKKSRVWVKSIAVKRLHWINKKKKKKIKLNKKIKVNQKLPSDYIELIKKLK